MLSQTLQESRPKSCGCYATVKQMPKKSPTESLNLFKPINPGNSKNSQCAPVSPWALELLVKACKRKEADSAAKFYRELSGVPTAAMFRGFLLKKLAQNSLDDIKSDADLKIRGLTDPNQTNWVYHGPIPRSTFDQSKFVTKINKAVKMNKPVHLVPLSPDLENLEAVYSVVYHPKDPILTCVQVTMNRKHPISVSGSPADPKVARTWFIVCKVPAQYIKQVAFLLHRAATYGVHLRIAEVQL